MKKIILLLFPVFIFHTLFTTSVCAQAPVNDDCTGAISITTSAFNVTCTAPIAASTVNATVSLPVPGCGSANADDDIWYSFTANSSSVVIRVSNALHIPSGTANIAMEIYSGTCGGFTSVLCINGFAFGSGFRIVNGLIAGNSYYIRFWTVSSVSDASFNFCVQDVPAPPVNDECSGAIPITTQPFGINCASSVSANTTGATHSTPDPSCGVNDSNDDIWYTFTANSQSIILRYTNAVLTTSGSSAVLGYALYSAGCPTTTATISCSSGFGFNDGFQIVDGLAIGNIYYLRLFSLSSNNYMSFDFCVQDVPAPPVNDECSGAIPITTQPFGMNCASSVSANTTGATHSTPDPSCGVNDSNDDIWYSFTANSQSIILRYTNGQLTTSTTGAVLGYALYSGSCPATTATVSCASGFGFNDGFQIINGLVTGNIYYLRLFSLSPNNYMSFDFCIQDVPPPPVNDDCSAAIPIITQPFGINCASSVSANTTGATHSTPNPSCGVNDSNDDIWYTFTANSQSIILRYTNGQLTTSTSGAVLGYALYSGNCPTTTATVSCSSGFGFNDGFQIINGLVTGNTYYLRLFSLSPNNYMSFDFCVQDVPAAPVNDECIGAIPITTQPFGTSCASSVSANTTGATHSTPDPSCGVNDSNDDIWYSFTANSQSIILRYTNGELTTSNSSAVLGYALYSGSCPTTTTTIACASGFGFNNGHHIINGLVIGNSYYLRLFSLTGNNYMSFDFCVQDVPVPPANDECAQAIPVALTLPGTNCSSSISANTNGATQSSNTPSCINNNSDNDDVWYSFTASAAIAVLRYSNCIETLSGSGASLGYALYNACPASSASMSCSNSFGFSSGSAVLTGLIPGNTYLLRLFSAGGNNYASFKFCIQAPLINDECVNAINIPVSNGFCTSPVISSLNGATVSAGFASPACAPGAGSKDVWFQTSIPSTGNLIVQTSAVKPSAHDLVMTAFIGNCGSLIQIACDDNGNPEPFPSANHSRIVLTGRTPGEVIMLRVTPFQSNSEEQFAICAWDETTSVLPPVSPGGNCITGAIKTIDSTLGNIYMWVPLFDNSGNIIAEIYSNGNDLGAITPDVFVNTSGTVRNVNGKFYLDRNITINPATNGTARVRFYFKHSELTALQAVDPLITGTNNLQIIKTPVNCQPLLTGTPTLINQDANALYGADHYMQFSTTSFSSFYTDRLDAVLPLKFLSFIANKEIGGIRLQWIVVKDPTIQLFSIERSQDGLHFDAIATQQKLDFITERNEEWEYVYTDVGYMPGILFYRIKMRDINGKILYSAVIRINPSSSGTPFVNVYPNPVDDFLVIEATMPAVGLQMEIFDMSGRRVETAGLPISQNGKAIIKTNGLPAGIYLLVVQEPLNKMRNHFKIVKR